MNSVPQVVKEPGSLNYVKFRLEELASELEFLEGDINTKLNRIERYSEPDDTQPLQPVCDPSDEILSGIHSALSRIRTVKENLAFANRHLDNLL